MKNRFLSITLVAMASISVTAMAESFRVGRLTIVQPWARPTPPGFTISAAYFRIDNPGAEPDKLVAVSSPVAGRSEIHTTIMSGNVARMRALKELAIPARGSARAEPRRKPCDAVAIEPATRRRSANSDQA